MSAQDPEAGIYVIAEAVRAWHAARGVRASVRRSRSSAPRYVELRTAPGPGVARGLAGAHDPVSDHPAAPDGSDAALTIYAEADPASCEAHLETVLEEFRAAARPRSPTPGRPGPARSVGCVARTSAPPV